MHTTDPAASSTLDATPRSTLNRRGFLRTAAIAGGGLVAASVAACAPASAGPTWTFGPGPNAGAQSPDPSPASSRSPAPAGPDPTATAMPSHAPTPSGVAGGHDEAAKAVVQRFLDGEGGTLEGTGNLPLEARDDGGVKVFEMTIDEIRHRVDAHKDPLDALGYNGTWPGPVLRVTEGDRVRATFRNNLHESTGVHFHGQRLPNAMDGVPLVTQDPIMPGDSFTYEFTARTPGSHMYHSHHNATDQVGRGLLGAFIVDPKDPAKRPERLYGVSQDIVWISNDSLGGFTINGRGFPATAPIVATLGDRILVRFMNEGVMMHPWHLHGMPMRVVARDGYPLGAAEFTCDTLGVNPGERWDVVIDCDEPGVWAFHCHVLTHAEGREGMFGMVTALLVREPATALGSTVRAASGVAAGLVCPVPGVT